MSEKVQLILFETESLPKAYKALEEMSSAGLEPLEFYPHANGARILLKAPDNFSSTLMPGAQSVTASIKVLKAMLSQTGNVLKKHLVIVETKSFIDLLRLANEFENIDAEILEIRSLRSNTAKNYAIFSVDEKEAAEKLVKNIDFTILNSSNPALKDFLGFT